MKKILMLISLVSCLILFSVTVVAQNKFIGVKACRPCHNTAKQGEQFPIWEKSPHAQAYKTLTTAKANEVAKAKGLSKPAAESPECLECHVITADAKLLEKSFDMKDGVQCETCHGAGSVYKNMTIMKDHAKSVAAGMREFKDEAAIEAYCKTCHNPKSPSYKEFKFKEYWDKTKHTVPKG
ncbi:MAG TPA: cytochrome c family protein [Bacteroidota bacterium]